MSGTVSINAVRPARATLRWQVSLRSLLTLTAMAGLTFAWWRTVGSTYFQSWPAYWQWQSWLVIDFIACPFLVPLAGPKIQANWHSGYLVKVWVLLAGANAVWGYVQILTAFSVTGPNAERHFIELLQEPLAAEFWTAFALPASLAVVASTATPQAARPRLWDYGLMVLVATNVLLLHRLIPFAFLKAWST